MILELSYYQNSIKYLSLCIKLILSISHLSRLRISIIFDKYWDIKDHNKLFCTFLDWIVDDDGINETSCSSKLAVIAFEMEVLSFAVVLVILCDLLLWRANVDAQDKLTFQVKYCIVFLYFFPNIYLFCIVMIIILWFDNPFKDNVIFV